MNYSDNISWLQFIVICFKGDMSDIRVCNIISNNTNNAEEIKSL